jgi:peptide subunit release factor 1 (eRF1)
VGFVNDVSEQTLRELAQLRTEDESFLSVYMDLDPREFATAPARATEIDSLLDGAAREIEAGERRHGERKALRAALERAREMLQGDHTWAPGARAVALFLCEPLGLSKLLRLPHPVRGAWVVSDSPFIAPLAETGPAGRVCVALVDERFARVLRGSQERLEEVMSFGDAVHGRHKQGGWSQARYQRSQHEGAEVHLRRTARALHDLLRVTPYEHLLIACAAPLWPRVVDKLPADVRARLHPDRLALDVGDASIDDVLSASADRFAELRRAREDAVLAELHEGIGRSDDGHAAAGLEHVLDALVQRRVATLLYDAQLRAAGVMCPRCGWLGAGGERCPVDDAELEPRESIVEEAVQAAVGQSAEVLALRDRSELGPLGGIAATLRF